MLELLLWLIPGCPLAASVLTAAAGRRLAQRSHQPCLVALGLSFACSLLVFLGQMLSPDPGEAGGELRGSAVLATGYEWIAAGNLTVYVKLQADALGSFMLLTVTLVSFLVAMYSVGYMHGQPGYSRYFAEISLFVFSMTMLVLAGNFLLLYVFWEAVGLCSYLLIGYWFERPSAAAAARKAFLVNRIGDFGFALGIFLTWYLVGQTLGWQPPAGQSLLDYALVFDTAGQLAEAYPAGVAVICLLLFAGAMGKSAQFPLHVWLPDAMEGPTPVSALIHAATMVTAGVYMMARCSPLLAWAPEAQAVIGGIGAFTALLAALIALTQHDLKRVLAYSTVSQLGFMFLALGCPAAGRELLAPAVVAAMFHLFTHAFFKALLFLGAGSVMHAMGDVIDMRRFGGLRKQLPTTHWTFLCGAVALAGLPLFSGFWSKDDILAVLAAAGHAERYGDYFGLLFAAALLTSVLTAFYTFRAYFLTFWGEERFPPEAGEHPHESPPIMLRPLVILAVFSLGIGLLVGPTHLVANYLTRTPGLSAAHSQHGPNLWVMAGSSLAALAGVGLAWGLYGVWPALPGLLERRLAWLHRLLANKFYCDEIAWWLVVRPLRVLAVLCEVLDRYLVDGLVDLVGWIPKRVGEILRPAQNGLAQSYALVMALGLTACVILMAMAS